MKDRPDKNYHFYENINQAIYYLKSYQYEKALNCIHIAMVLDDSSADAQNLLGIYYELTGKYLCAQKHYHAAISLDPAYKPALHNLERITCYQANQIFKTIDFGEITQKQIRRSKNMSFKTQFIQGGTTCD